MQIALCMSFARHTEYVQRTWTMEVYFRYLCCLHMPAKYNCLLRTSQTDSVRTSSSGYGTWGCSEDRLHANYSWPVQRGGWPAARLRPEDGPSALCGAGMLERNKPTSDTSLFLIMLRIYINYQGQGRSTSR